MKTENQNMDMKCIEEKLLKPQNGAVMLILELIGLVAFIGLFAFGVFLAAGEISGLGGAFAIIGAIIGIVTVCIGFAGLKTVRPNEALV